MSDTIPTWSFSRLKDFESCHYKAFLKYSEKRSQEHMDMTAADRGSMIHKACEAFVKREGPLIKEMKRFTEYFENLKTKYEEGLVELEENWGFTKDWEPTGWFDEDVWCRMKLDNFIYDDLRIDVNEMVTEWTKQPISATATDYKSGKKFGNEVSHGQQGQIYVLGSFLRYPTLEECNVNFIYLDHPIGTSSTRYYTREKAMKFLPSWNERALRMTTAEEFPPNPNKITCMWCPYGPQHGDGSCQWGV